MTEKEWLECDELAAMIRHSPPLVSSRKKLLFACGAMRLRPDRLDEAVIERHERRPDGEAHESLSDWESSPALAPGSRFDHASLTELLIGALEHGLILGKVVGMPSPGEQRLCELLRDVAGNPFRPSLIDPRWLSWEGGTIPNLARAIYDERAFDRMPILGDALEEAGCADDAILSHCRGPGPHVRGCWVVDLILTDCR